MKRAAFLVCLLAGGCRMVAHVTEDAVPVTIVAVPSLEQVPALDDLEDSLEDSRVVYLGESHNNDNHHAFQFQMVRWLHEQDERLLIGMEMFQRPYQEHLDRFVAGEIGEEEMLRRTEYFTRWKWDYRYYRPILLYARAHGIPVIALNAPGEINRKVARGGLAALSDEERKWVAKDIDLTIAAHREFVMAVFQGHPMPPGFNFENFYASQCLWEDTMAESVATALDGRPGYRMAVIVGSGHVRQRFGIPMRADARGAKPSTVFVGMDREDGEIADPAPLAAEDPGDFLYYTDPAPEMPPSPKLGVNLAQGPMAAGEGLLVMGVPEGGLAAAAGVKAGDRLTALNGSPLKTLEDLQIGLALLEGAGGTVEVLRGTERLPLPFSTVKVAP